jgi:hypothetical protein
MEMPISKGPGGREKIAMALVEDVLRTWSLADIEQLVEEMEIKLRRPSRAPQL